MRQRLISSTIPVFLEPNGVIHAQQAPDRVGHTGSPVRQLVVALLVAALLPAVVACDSNSSDGATEGTVGTVRGLIQEVKSASLLEVESLVVLDENGNLWEFETRGKRFAEFAPSHLREHMVLGQQVSVTYHSEGIVLVADRIAD